MHVKVTVRSRRYKVGFSQVWISAKNWHIGPRGHRCGLFAIAAANYATRTVNGLKWASNRLKQ